MSNQKEFERFAEQYRRLAEDDDVAVDRDALQSMAHAWLQLAAEEERIADLVRAADEIFSPPMNSVDARLHRARESTPSAVPAS